ncbi:MAG: hypothetical protein ACJ8AS_03915 [Hyphomicrobiales bacterium]
MGQIENEVNGRAEAITISERARQHGRSFEDEAHAIVAREGKLSPAEFAEIANRIRRTTPKGIKQTDSTEMVRELRDSDHGGR